MVDVKRVAFFDEIAEKWDTWEDLPALQQKLAAGLDEFGVRPNETVLDIGCGTGNLTQALLKRLSPEGRIVAVDISPCMIARAQDKNPDLRVTWHCTNVCELPLADESCDRVFCYSVWPHFDKPGAAIGELRRVLRLSGFLHVWHLRPREEINAIHASAGEAVRHDILPPAGEVADRLLQAGFQVITTIDDSKQYLVNAIKTSRDSTLR